MEVILLERIEKLGQMGDVVNVKPGYARNYLLPQKKAVRATEDSRKRFDEQRAQLEATNLERRSEAEKVAVKLDGLSVVLIRQAGEGGQLYGSVNARDIAEAVSEAGITIRRQQVWLSQPIKALGLHPISVNLHPEVTVRVTINVARSPAEAETQAQTGRAIARADEDEIPPEVVIEEQAKEVFEEEVVDQAIEDLQIDEVAEGGDEQEIKAAKAKDASSE
jgi:large subunit ribosomal protein L9